MRSYTTDDFWELYRALPPDIRRQAREAHERFSQNPFHPDLNFEEVDRKRGLWSARVTRGYRVLGIREDSEITWFWIGSHGAYDRLIKGR